MTRLEMQGLTVKYPGRKQPVLQDVTLHLREGETVLLLGTSGSGKSTLALTLNGLIPHSLGQILAGRVICDGLDTQKTESATLAQHVGIVFQDPDAQFVALTVEEELIFGLENLCVPPEEMGRRVEQALSRVGLPTANLDPVGTQEVFSLIRACQEADPRRTILLIEHKLDDLMDLIDRVVVLGPFGTILVDGEPRAIFRDAFLTLQQQGVWQPQVVSLAHHLRREGIILDLFPLTSGEAEQALQQVSFSPRAGEKTPVAHEPSRSALPAIEVCDLSFRYGERQVLDHITLTVPEGTFLALVGTNGAGKTTLAQHLLGILRPPLGTIALHGRDLTRIPARELMTEVGYVFQNPEHQFITDSVAGEISYGLRVMKRPEKEIEQKTQELLERFGLAKRARANPFTLSHGEKRRLSVTTMLAIGQRTLILDEPTFGQDQRNAEMLLELLSTLHAEGRTIIVVTHDMALVADYAQQVVVMHQGKILFNGTPDALFRHPELLTQARLFPPPLVQLAQRLEWPYLLTGRMLASSQIRAELSPQAIAQE